MRPRTLVITAALLNLLVIVLCVSYYGWNLQGAGSATRNTARFASLWFLVSFASAGVRRWLPSLPETPLLARAFVAAQMVHFAMVVALHASFQVPKTPPLGPAVILSTGIGFSLVAIYGYTATARNTRLHRFGQTLTAYAIFTIYAVDYAKHPIHALRLMTIAVVAALILRLSSGRSGRAISARA